VNTLAFNPRYLKAAVILFFVLMIVASCNGEQYTDPFGGEWF
jgi:hypothetical protein